MKKDVARPGESDDWSASHWTKDSWTSDAGWNFTKSYIAWMVATPLHAANTWCSGPWLHTIEHAWYYGITTEFCRSYKSFVFANSETEACKESCMIHFPTIPPCSTKVDVLETCDVPILFSLSDKKLGYDY